MASQVLFSDALFDDLRCRAGARPKVSLHSERMVPWRVGMATKNETHFWKAAVTYEMYNSSPIVMCFWFFGTKDLLTSAQLRREHRRADLAIAYDFSMRTVLNEDGLHGKLVRGKLSLTGAGLEPSASTESAIQLENLETLETALSAFFQPPNCTV